MIRLLFFLMPFTLLGQIGGDLSFQALNISTNPRTAALAGTTVSISGDLSQFFENPATLDSVEAKTLFLHVNPYFAETQHLGLAYLTKVSNQPVAFGINYLGFGDFASYDATGVEIGTYTANDYVISAGTYDKIGLMTIGATIKLASTSIEAYQNTALAFDIGGIFQLSRNWSAGMVFENMGFGLNANNEEVLPFDVKLGTTFKPEYMPFRFTITTNNLTDQNFEATQQTDTRSNEGINQVLKRVNIGAELLLGPGFQLLFGYNHKRAQELKLETLGGGAGFSYGVMIKVKKLYLRYTRATYHAAGGSSFISLQTTFNKKNKIL